MNHPTFKELFAVGVERLLMSPQQADEALTELINSDGYGVLTLAVSCRRHTLLAKLSEYSPYDNPQEIVRIQAELACYDSLMDGLPDAVDEYFVEYINKKKEKDRKDKEVQEEEIPLHIGI